MVAVTERINKKTREIDIRNGEEIARLLNAEDKKVARAVSRILPQIGLAIEKTAAELKNGGRLAYFGCGTSGRIAILDSAEMPPTFGVAPTLVQAYIAGGDKAIRHAVENAEDSAKLAVADYKKFAAAPHDVIVAISASGNPKYILKVLELAQKDGLLTIGISSNSAAKMKECVDIFLNPLVGPEAITGSSRLKSGTAQKMILNMLSTGVMIKLGKTYRNYMIDLQVTNQKLRQRALRFVREITGADETMAQTALNKAQNVKTACVMIKRNCSQEQAEKLLKENEGILRRII